MEYRQLGHSDLNVSAICLGTMTYGDQNTEAEAHEQLSYAVDQGINFIDTAEMYPVPPKAETCTRTETMIGTWLKHQARDQLIINTKIAGPRRGIHWIRNGPASLDRANIREALEGSLKRLQTDYVDVLQLHWPERNVPMFGQYQFDPAGEYASGVYQQGETKEWVSIRAQLEALAELVEEGKVRYIGISNEYPWGVMQFLKAAEEFNLPRLVTIQNAYHLLNRTMEFGMTEVLYRENIGLMAYSPLAFGHLTAKYIQDPQAVGRVTLFLGYAQRYSKPGVVPAVKAYAALAKQHGLTATELALAFVYHRWCVTSTIIGATSMAQLQENIAAWQVTLSPEILAEIDQIHFSIMNPAP